MAWWGLKVSSPGYCSPLNKLGPWDSFQKNHWGHCPPPRLHEEDGYPGYCEKELRQFNFLPIDWGIPEAQDWDPLLN